MTSETCAAYSGGTDRSFSPRWALAGLSLSILLGALGTSSANVALPTLAQDFGASFQQVQWIVLAYLLAITTLIVSAGRLGDIIGRRRLLLAGIALFTLASILCGLAPSLSLLIAARALQGLGAGVMMTLALAFVGETVPKERTGSAMGLLGTMSAVGTALGPSLGGVLIAGLGWRSIFLLMALIGGLNVLFAYRCLPAPQQKVKSSANSFDSLGTLLLGLTLGAYALAMTVGHGHFDRFNAALLGAAVLGLCLFVLAEARVASPLIRLTAFRDSVLSASLATNVLVATVITTTLLVPPFYLAHTLGLNAVAVGLVMSTGTVVSVLTGIPAGRIVDRFGTTSIVTFGLIQMAAGALALSVLPMMFGVVGYVVGVAIMAPGYQLFQAANNTAVMMNVSNDQRGVISGMLNLSRNLGLITGASVMGALFAFAAGASDITAADPQAIATGMKITFLVDAALIVVALAIAVANHAFNTSKADQSASAGR